MAQDGEIGFLLSQRLDLVNDKPRDELDSAARGHLGSLRYTGRIVTQQHKKIPVDHRSRRTCVQSQSNDGIAGRSVESSRNND